MRQKETTKLNALMDKLWLSRGNELNKKLYSQTLLMMWISPFDIIALDELLIEKGLYDWWCMYTYVRSKLNDEEYTSFLILFWLD